MSVLRTPSHNPDVASRKVEDKLTYLQTADSWMQKVRNMLGRMNELAVMANDGAASAGDTNILRNEFARMQQEIERITWENQFGYNGAR